MIYVLHFKDLQYLDCSTSLNIFVLTQHDKGVWDFGYSYFALDFNYFDLFFWTIGMKGKMSYYTYFSIVRDV